MRMLKRDYTTTVSATIRLTRGLYISQDPIRLQGGDKLYSYVHDVNGWVDEFGLLELFRSMTREEYFDIQNNGWQAGGDTGGMGSKWFAENYENAVEWGKTMGHGSDSKFYVVGFEIDDVVANNAYQVNDLDGIGNARCIDVDQLNSNATPVTSLNSIRCS